MSSSKIVEAKRLVESWQDCGCSGLSFQTFCLELQVTMPKGKAIVQNLKVAGVIKEVVFGQLKFAPKEGKSI